jgi:hypothetical protein
LALFCIIWTTPPVAYFGSIQQQKPSLHKFLLGDWERTEYYNLFSVFFEHLSLGGHTISSYLSTGAPFVVGGSTTYNTSLSLFYRLI